ncbi:MAG: HRDC domain-containing protein, partial [Bacteroidota bacterium]|nr:HRDC domain-containing protein [Bacteroidota bacterium]
ISAFAWLAAYSLPKRSFSVAKKLKYFFQKARSVSRAFWKKNILVFCKFIKYRIMQIKIFIISIIDCVDEEENLNKFLSSHKIVNVKQEFVSNEQGDYLIFIVRYMAHNSGEKSSRYKKPKKDYREILEPSVYAAFTLLRECRKEISFEEGLPVYSIFLNDELAKIADLKEINFSEAKKIKGIGEKKAKDYLEKLLQLYKEKEIKK